MRVLATAKVKAVAPNPSHFAELLEFLKAYRDWTQYIVDEIWSDKRIPSMKKLHYRFYKILRKQGFRAHHCHKIERRAREVVKAVKKNNGRKPVLRKLTARLDYQDYKLDLSSKTIRIAILNNKWVVLKLLWYNYLDKYFISTWKLKEILASYRDNTIWIYLIFEKELVLKQPRAIMGVDINFNNITYTIVNMDGELITIGAIPFNGLRRALTHKIIIEKIQKKYSKNWRYIKGIKEVIRRHGRRARNILIDSSHYISRRIVEIAKEYNALIVLEDLKKLKNGVNGSRRFNKKLSLWTYRRIQSFVHYKALLEGIPVTYVNPKHTSKTSPIGGKLSFVNYKWAKLPNGYVVTRDIIASWNLALKELKLLTRDVGSCGFVVSLKAPDGDETPTPMKGKPMQVSVVSKIPKR